MSTNFCECCKLPKSLTCKTCKIEKTPNEFDTGRKSCKACRKEYNAMQYMKRKNINIVVQRNDLN